MLNRDDMFEMVTELKPAQLRGFCQLVTQILTQGQLKRLEPYFITKLEFDFEGALQSTQKPTMKSKPEDILRQDPRLMVDEMSEEDMEKARLYDNDKYISKYEDEDNDDSESGDGDEEEDSSEYDVKPSR